jgi:SAM-dependent methyltransferase
MEYVTMTPDGWTTVLPSIVDRLRRYQQSDVDQTISANDNMFQPHRREHYFAVGRDAVGIVALAMMKAGVAGFVNVLDLPCGSGRVLRHLVRFLPESYVMASDIDPRHVDFCVSQFHVAGLLSNEDLNQVTPDRSVDLLWCGSLLTHLGADRFRVVLRRMIGWLSSGGIGIFTLHGRWSMHRQAMTPYKYISDEAFAPIAEGVVQDGFGYNDYPTGAERLGQARYGLSICLPSWIMRTVEAMEDVRLIDYTERGWDNHQDVLILRRLPIAGRPWLFEDREDA